MINCKLQRKIQECLHNFWQKCVLYAFVSLQIPYVFAPKYAMFHFSRHIKKPNFKLFHTLNHLKIAQWSHSTPMNKKNPVECTQYKKTPQKFIKMCHASLQFQSLSAHTRPYTKFSCRNFFIFVIFL